VPDDATGPPADPPTVPPAARPSSAAPPPAAARPVPFGRRVADLAAAHPDAVALVVAHADGRDEAVTWQELEARARAAAHLLARRGLGTGDLLAVALPNCAEHVVAALAGWKLGACVCPLRPDLPGWERDRVLAVARPAVLVGDWAIDACPTVRRGELASAPPSDDPLPDAIAPRSMAVASGGATGTPKIIVTPTPSAAVPGAAAQVTPGGYPGGAGHVQLVPGPLYHTNGFAICHLSLFEDQQVVLMERFDAARAVDLVERYRVSVVTMAPTMLARIARLSGIEGRDLSSLRGVLQGAASCPEWVLHRWIELIGAQHVFVAYGSTERVGLCMVRGDDWLARPGTVGRGVNTDIRILDDAGRDLPPGEVGEIFMRSRLAGDAPTHEYLGADPARRTPDGFTSIGDMGWLDGDGYLYIADRRVDMIVSGGANVFPAEVEAALSEHPGVADVAVIGLPDPEWGQRVVALVEPADPASPPGPDVLDAHARARLAAYKVPRSYEVVDRLPRTAAGKLNRRALVEARRSAG
jgi:bile acid-coenzyme A ligase